MTCSIIYIVQAPMLSVFIPFMPLNPPISQIARATHPLLFHHHIAHPGNCLAHVTHTSCSIWMVPTAKIWSRLGCPSYGRHAPRMGSLVCSMVGKQTCFLPWNAVVLRSGADVPPAVITLLPPWPSLSWSRLAGPFNMGQNCITFTVWSFYHCTESFMSVWGHSGRA